MNTTQTIKALVFDAYGTLFDVRSVTSLCNRLFPDQGIALSQAWRGKQLEYTWLRSLMGQYDDFWHVTESALAFACKSLDLVCEPEARDQLMDAYLHLDPYPEVQQALHTLSDFQLAILSNGSPRMLQAAVQSAGLEGVFAHVISVNEVKVYKPDPRVYQLASQKLLVDASAIGFVSSNSWDAIGAKASGLWVCWANRTNIPADELGFTPDLTVNSLAGLASYYGDEYAV